MWLRYSRERARQKVANLNLKSFNYNFAHDSGKLLPILPIGCRRTRGEALRPTKPPEADELQEVAGPGVPANRYQPRKRSQNGSLYNSDGSDGLCCQLCIPRVFLNNSVFQNRLFVSP